MSFVASNYRTEMQAVAAKQDATFGERLTIIPCDKQPNRSATPDHTRAVDVVGIFSWPSIDALDHDRLTREGRPVVVSRDPVASFARNALPFTPKAGDWLRRCCDGSLFEITKSRPDGVSRIRFELLQMGVPHP